MWNSALWPLAFFLVAHRVLVLARAGAPTDDFTTVWSAAKRFVDRVPVYSEIYHHVDPHYLYNPGATLLLSPLGLISDVETARPWFIIFNALAVICALGMLVKLHGYRLSHPLFPGAICAAYCTEAVMNTLIFANINGVLLLVFTGFLGAYINKKYAVAGVLLGIAIVIKPMFAPLAVLPLMQLNVLPSALALAIPVLLNLIAWPLTPGAKDYVEKVVPYLGLTRDYANSSLAGFHVYFDSPRSLHLLIFSAATLAVAVALLGLARWRFSDEHLWLVLSSTVLLTGVFLLSSLGQAYYSMMLFPAIFTMLRKHSPMSSIVTWTGIFLCLLPLQWALPEKPLVQAWLTTFLPTIGWMLIVITIATWTVATIYPHLNPKEVPYHDQPKSAAK